jgi:hypothetical protein
METGTELARHSSENTPIPAACPAPLACSVAWARRPIRRRAWRAIVQWRVMARRRRYTGTLRPITTARWRAAGLNARSAGAPYGGVRRAPNPSPNRTQARAAKLRRACRISENCPCCLEKKSGARFLSGMSQESWPRHAMPRHRTRWPTTTSVYACSRRQGPVSSRGSRLASVSWG